MATAMRERVMRLVNSDDAESLSGRARARRWQEFSRRFPEIGGMRVLDLGGTPRFWRMAPQRPAHVTIVNLIAEPAPEDWIDCLAADACALRPSERYDLVVSNSLIEHVGGDRQRRRLAEVVRAAAPHYWVQTPNRYFPVEPHWLFPLAQFLPQAARAQLSLRWPYGHERASTLAEARSSALGIELLNARQMRELFQDAEIWREHFGGLTKSLVAVRCVP